MSGKRIVLVVCVALVPLLACSGLTISAGLIVKNVVTTRPCQPPPYETGLIAAYTAEPLLTTGRPTRSAGTPEIRHFCDLVGVEDIHPLSYTEVTYRYPANDWRTAQDLMAAYEPDAATEGWGYAGNRDDDATAAIEFCHSVTGLTSTLIIALLRGNVTGGPTVEARQIVSVPAHASCPFESGLWGPSYRP